MSLVFHLIILILEIVVIICAVKEKNRKYFKIFNGLFFGFFISMFIHYIYFSSDIYLYDTGEWRGLEALLQLISLCMINFVIALVCLIIQKYSKKKNYIDTSKKWVTIKCVLIVSAASFIIIFSLFIIRYNDKVQLDNEVKEEVMIYLKEKYGTSDFEILDIDRKFSANGLVATNNLEYYDVNVLYKQSNIEFHVELDVDNERKILRNSSSDWFLFKYYYNEFEDDDFRVDGNIKMNVFFDYLKKKNLNVEVEMSDHYASGGEIEKILPNGYGRIPDKKEFYNLIIDYQLKHKMKITINKNELVGNDLKEELRNYLVNLANYIIDYYDEIEDYQIYCEYYGNDDFFKGNLYIDKDYINIDVGSIKETIKR